MRKSRLTNGANIYAIKVDHYVTGGVFAAALACYYYESSKEFSNNLSKKEAKEILLKELRYGGDLSNYDRTGLFEGALDSNDIYDPIYEAAYEWVIKNYPYLIKEVTNG